MFKQPSQRNELGNLLFVLCCCPSMGVSFPIAIAPFHCSSITLASIQFVLTSEFSATGKPLLPGSYIEASSTGEYSCSMMNLIIFLLYRHCLLLCLVIVFRSVMSMIMHRCLRSFVIMQQFKKAAHRSNLYSLSLPRTLTPRRKTLCTPWTNKAKVTLLFKVIPE